MSGKADRLLADAFHQAAVAGERPGPVVDEVVAELRIEVALRDRHAHRIGKALAQRTGRRFDAGAMAVFGMPRGPCADLAEVADLIQRDVRVSGQEKQRIEQHRTVPGRKHEAVAVGPARLCRVEVHGLREQYRCDVGGAHGQAGVAGIGFLDGVNRKEADGIGHVRVNVLVLH